MDDALEHANGELVSDDIYNYLMGERMFLFVVKNPRLCGAAVCEIIQYVRKKAVRVVTLGGEEFDGWKDVLNDRLMEWAQRIGADGIESYVRKGMAVKLEELGYVPIYTGMWRKVKDG